MFFFSNSINILRKKVRNWNKLSFCFLEFIKNFPSVFRHVYYSEVYAEYFLGKNVASEVADALCSSVGLKLQGKTVGSFSSEFSNWFRFSPEKGF